MLATYYPIIYWNCACLITNSGGTLDNKNSEDNAENEDEEEDTEQDENNIKKKNKNTDYGKVATAIGNFQMSGINVSPPDINQSSYTFTPAVKTNTILYGLRGIARISGDKINEIINARPYTSLKDFLSKNKLNITQIVNLIKSGAFDAIENKSREKIMHDFLLSTVDIKNDLNLRNMQMLITKNLIPEEMIFYKKLFLFNKFLKENKESTYYNLNDAAINYITRNFDVDLIEDGVRISQKTWDKLYSKSMNPMRDYIKAHKEEMLQQLNDSIYNEIAEKYSDGNISKWEMDSISFYYHNHELAEVAKDYDDFFTLPEEPEIEYTFKSAGGQEIKVYKLNKIIGTVIDKDKMHNTITLLTPTGVVAVKIYKNQFALYDKQLSQRGEDGKKHIIEKSWLSRGTKLMIQGIRRENNFISKKRRNSVFPIISKITSVDGDNLTFQFERVEVEE